MGKIEEFVEEAFNKHRNGVITLKELILTLCGYADTNIRSEGNMSIFGDAVGKEFDSNGNIAQ